MTSFKPRVHEEREVEKYLLKLCQPEEIFIIQVRGEGFE